MQRVVDIFTDGACSTKTKCGGWACIIVEDDVELSRYEGAEIDTTNNRMELQAFLTALKVANEIETQNTEVNIFSDSAYIVNCFDEQWYLRWQLNGWRASDKQPVKNKELWQEIIEQHKLAHRHLKLNIYKVKAHSGCLWNELADKWAVMQKNKLESEQ